MNQERLQPLKDEDLLAFTTDSVFDSMLMEKNPEEQRRIAAHLLWLSNERDAYQKELYDTINVLSKQLRDSQKLPMMIKGKIRRKALKQLAVRRRLLEAKP